MASMKERFVITHLRHIAGRQHPLVHQRKRGNLHGKQFPTRFISAGDLRGQPRLVVLTPPPPLRPPTSIPDRELRERAF